MVHRIQNRNPGYSDFGVSNLAGSFSFANNTSNTVTHGANALKLENEIVTENFNDTASNINNQYHKELLKNQDVENIIENTSEENEVSFSKEAIEEPVSEKENSVDLKEFGVNADEPDLFSSDNSEVSSENLLSSSSDENEDDDLEIPAFLRRQKN